MHEEKVRWGTRRTTIFTQSTIFFMKFLMNTNETKNHLIQERCSCSHMKKETNEVIKICLKGYNFELYEKIQPTIKTM